MKLAACLAMTLCAFAGVSAHAQTAAGMDMGKMSANGHMRLTPPEEETGPWKGNAQAEARLWQFARCAVHSDRNKAAWVLESQPQTPDEQHRTVKLFSESLCTRAAGPMKMKNEVVRWALAEQLYVDGGKDVPAAGGVPVTVAAGDAYALGACVAQRDPRDADAFVRTQRRSPAEQAALKAIIPAINACAGVNRIDLSGAEIHGVLGEALYRMRGTAAQGKN